MWQYAEDQIEFAILGLVKDPILEILANLVASIEHINALNARLDQMQPGWRKNASLDPSDELHAALRAEYDVDGLPAKSRCEDAALVADAKLEDVLELRQALIAKQAALKVDLQEQAQSRSEVESKASSRRQDFGAKIQRFAQVVFARQARSQ